MTMDSANPAVRPTESDPVECLDHPTMGNEGSGLSSTPVDGRASEKDENERIARKERIWEEAEKW